MSLYAGSVIAQLIKGVAMSKLYLVPTPIGNLEDMSFRAVRILKEVNFILAEDTRTSKKLMQHYQIETSLSPYHKFNEHKQLEELEKDFEKKFKTSKLSKKISLKDKSK